MHYFIYIVYIIAGYFVSGYAETRFGRGAGGFAVLALFLGFIGLLLIWE